VIAPLDPERSRAAPSVAARNRLTALVLLGWVAGLALAALLTVWLRG